MNAAAARRLLLIHAFEQAPDALWSPADAAWATAEARRAEGSSAPAEQLLARRAELATQRLTAREPVIAHWLEGHGLPGWAIVAALMAAFAMGLALDGYGGHAHVNVLALPLLGLMGWNVAVYALLGVQAMRTLATPRDAVTSPAHSLRGALAHAGAWIARKLAGARPGSMAALSRFALTWADAARPLHGARTAAALHASAAAVALGLVAGLYLRGLAFEYRAGWESTFLDARGVHALVSMLLGPAAALLGDPLPGLDTLAALRFPASAGENAAPWIHRIALTVGWVVVAPRLLLALGAVRRARRLERDLPIDLHAPGFARLVREMSGAGLLVRVQPHGHRLAADRAAALEHLFVRTLGGSMKLDLAAPAAYGDAPPDDSPIGTPQLVLFSAAATPEAEVQGDYLRTLARAGGVAAALIDETDLRRRMSGPDAPSRLEQRRRAWRSMLDAIGIAPVFIDLDADAGDAPAQALADALRRAGQRVTE